MERNRDGENVGGKMIDTKESRHGDANDRYDSMLPRRKEET